MAIDKYFEGEKGRITILDEKSSMQVEHRLALEEESQEEKPRAKQGMEHPDERARDFREVEKGFDEEQAWYEAMRCLRCDLERELRESDASEENW